MSDIASLPDGLDRETECFLGSSTDLFQCRQSLSNTDCFIQSISGSMKLAFLNETLLCQEKKKSLLVFET